MVYNKRLFDKNEMYVNGWAIKLKFDIVPSIRNASCHSNSCPIVVPSVLSIFSNRFFFICDCYDCCCFLSMKNSASICIHYLPPSKPMFVDLPVHFVCSKSWFSFISQIVHCFLSVFLLACFLLYKFYCSKIYSSEYLKNVNRFHCFVDFSH